MDLAESWLTKIDVDGLDGAPQLGQRLSEVLFEIGFAEHAKGHNEDGIRWLEKAHDLMRVRAATFSTNDMEFRVIVSHRLARVFMSIPGRSKEAWSIISNLDSKCNPRLAVLMSILDYYDYNSDSNGIYDQNYQETIIRMARLPHLTDSMFDTILHYTHRLRTRSSKLAYRSLSSFIVERLLVSNKPEWLEKALLLLIWISTNSADVMADIDKLRGLLDTILAQRAPEVGSLVMSHAAQAVSSR